MNYLRSWKCERCNASQATIDRPDVEVCDRCINAQLVLRDAWSPQALHRLVERAYNRGYKHGKVRGRLEAVESLRTAAGTDGCHGSVPAFFVAADFLEV